MNEALLTKLEGMIKLLDNQVTKEDFVSAFENVLKVVVQIEKKTSEAITSLEQTYQQMISRMQNDHSATLTDLKGQVSSLFVGDKVKAMQAEHSQRMSAVDSKLKSVDAKMARVKDGLPGPKGDKGERGFTGKTENLTDLYKRIDTLESELKKQKNRPTYITAGAGNMRGIVHAIDLSSSLNGVTKTFNIQAVWRIISVHLSSVPNILRETTDYTWTPTSITFTSEIDAASSLATGQTCILIVADA